MEQELSLLTKLYEGNAKLFNFHPRHDGTKKERLFYLLREHPNKTKAFYKSQLFDDGYKGTGYEVLRRGFLSELLQCFAPIIVGDSTDDKKRVKTKLIFLREIAALKYLLTLQVGILSSIRMILEMQRRKALKLGLLEDEYWLANTCLVSWMANGDIQKTTFYQKKLADVSSAININNQILKAKSILDVHLVSKKNANTYFIKKVESDISELTKLIAGSRREVFQPKISFLKLRLSDFKKDFVAMKKEGVALWSNRSSLPITIPSSVIAGYIFYACANLQNDKEVKKWKSVAFELVDAGSINWFVFKEVFVGYSLFHFRIQEALEGLLEVHKIDDLKERLPRFKIQLFELYYGFIKFLADSGQVELHQIFRYGSVFNGSKDEIQSDKTGVNVSVLVLDFLNRLNEDKYESLIDMEDSLARYVSRNLKGEENQRPKVFIGMLLKVIQLDFNAFEVEKKTRRQLEKLKAMKPNLNMNMGGNEIIRYEVLWEWILKKLKESSLLPKPKS